MACTSSGPSAIRSVRAMAYIRASGTSSDTPAPPCAWMAWSMTQRAVRGTTTLIAEISVRASRLPTVSISHAVFNTRSRACSIRHRDSAIHSWTTPLSAIADPKAWRSLLRAIISSRARSAMPIARMQWWIRPGPSRAWAIIAPSPSPAIRLPLGTRTPSKRTTPWPPRSWYPNTERPRSTSTPGASIGTRIIEWRRLRSASGSVTPITIATLQVSPRAPVVHHLRPVST